MKQINYDASLMEYYAAIKNDEVDTYAFVYKWNKCI